MTVQFFLCYNTLKLFREFIRLFQKVIMSFALSFVDFCKLMGLRSESVLSGAKKHKNRPISDKKFNEASTKLKESFKRLFGFTFEEAKENIDLKNESFDQFSTRGW